MNSRFSRMAALVMILCTVLSAFAIPAGAENVGSVTVSFPVDGTTYHIYRVGSLVNGEIVMDDAFKGVDASDYAAAASVMADMIRMTDAAKELTSGKVAGGKVQFTDLPMGIYLVTGDSCTVDSISYWPTPALLSMPQTDDAGSFVWEAKISGKYEMETEIGVVKKWVGDQLIYRPSSVTVHLMLDGKPYGDPVVLDYTNNWSYVWEHLPPKNWYVTEDPNPRYSTTITRDGNVYTVINTWKRLPQTGQLWWPVSALTLAGIAFVCLGLVRRRKSDENA